MTFSNMLTAFSGRENRQRTGSKKTRKFRSVFHSLLLLSLIIPWIDTKAVAAPIHLPANDDADQKAAVLLSRLSPEERVGQLFLVTFKGTDFSQDSQIYDLIVKHHVGGVVLTNANNNFVGPENTLAEVQNLTTGLQQLAWDSKNTLGGGVPDNYVPLFIGISQEGDLNPNDQIINGMTPLPNQMAIGATWNTELARKVGNVMGMELQNLGFNLYLGPSLDVLDVLPVEGGEDLGTRTFGGDPFWVGEMGKAYISGLHEGSQDSMVVISKHFPGRGGSDRPAEDEVATVRKSLEQLKQIELAPFFSVASPSTPESSITDGLLISHIRYQGFQGNIRVTTRPVSFDPSALSQLMAIEPLKTWRDSGGIMVSDDLGSTAVKKFFDPTNQSFDARQVARNALLAGNDLLYVNNFIASGDPDSYTTLLRTLDFFAQKYREDPAFAQRINSSVQRLLATKLRSYPQFDLGKIQPDPSGLLNIGQSSELVFDVATDAVTLISPSVIELDAILPGPPEAFDYIIFFTDYLGGQQCSRCIEQPMLGVDDFEKAVLKLYGPQAGGQVNQARLSSYTFSDLQNIMNGVTELPDLESEIRQADWIVFAMLDVDQNRPASTTFRKFLSTRPDLYRDKKIMAFAFNAPYYLDSTDISKITAYYGIYSKVPGFINTAARILFQELQPIGSLPVTVPGIGYDLINATSPDPTQVIPLVLDLPEDQSPEGSPIPEITLTPTPPTLFNVGDNLPLKTGVIYDHNGHPVPDGTVVRFIFSQGGEGGALTQIESTTTAGIARASFRIVSTGLLEIKAVSDPANASQLLRLDISGPGGGMITAIAPTPIPSITLEPTITIQPTPSGTATPDTGSQSESRLVTWLLVILILWAAAAGVYWFTSWRFSIRWGVRYALGGVVGGILGYLLSMLWWQKNVTDSAGLGGIRVLMIAILGMLFGWAAVWIWYRKFGANIPPSRSTKSTTLPKSPQG
ncbi:MAG: glycoside hydrolase family 3 N-terminal domain-containing protein [Anaerolineaceae bacterium]